MVSWYQDGQFGGYNGAVGHWVQDTYKLASPGTVHVQAITRLQRALPAWPEPTYPNHIFASAPLTFTAGDITANAGKFLTATMFIAASSKFDPGVVPTISQIIAASEGVARAATGTKTAGNFHFGLDAGPAPVAANTMVWIAVVPTAVVSMSSTPSIANDKPMAGMVVNTGGRAVSMWTNRTPLAPTITSPANGAVVAPGSQVQFSYTPNDPDRVTPDDPTRDNRDLAGVQVQYAAMPSVIDPNPTWFDLPYYTAQTAPRYASFIRGQADWVQVDGRDKMIDDMGFKILCGSDDPTPSVGVLPGGTWQIRCRTFDYGHPYPDIARPLGIESGLYTADTYPASNTSPWSTPITITVPSQVPPPIPISPSNEVAVVEGETVRLSWQYRNTFTPPFPQAKRWVQIRKVGDPDWSTVFAGPGANPYVDLPPIIDNPPPVPPIEYLTNGGFETDNVDGWTAYDYLGWCDGTQTVENTLDASQAHSGSRWLRMVYGGINAPTFSRVVTLDPGHDTFRLKTWFAPTAAMDIGMYSGWLWLDAGGVELPEAVQPDIGITAPGGIPAGQYGFFDSGDQPRPAGAVFARLLVYGVGFAAGGYGDCRLDDVSFIGTNSTNTDDFSLEATTRYEWRVATEDSDGKVSTYSSPARFWIVPGAGSGPVRPIPADTIDGATLGCGKNRAFIYRRGGTRRVAEIRNISLLEWGRVRDDISLAKIEVTDWDIDCGNLLATLQTWAYELVIYRDNGFSVDRVWEGPITLLTYEWDKVTIQAKDVMGYAYRRIIKQNMNDTGSSATAGDTVVNRAVRVLRNAFAPDDPNVLAYLTPLNREDDAKQYRSTPPYSRTAFEEVDDMASNAGLDYTCVGRSILLWGTKHRIGTLPEFRDANLGSPPIVSEYGMSMANRYAISDGNGLWGEATRLDVSGNDPTYGLVEMLSSTWASDSTENSTTYTEAGRQTVIESFEEFAERSIADRYPPPVVVRVPDNTTLSPDTVISIQHLVPGVVVPLRSTGTLRKVVASQKLDSVKVVQDSKGEKISITLSPFSRDDAALEGDAE